MTKTSFSRETLPKPTSRARPGQQERRSAWAGLKGMNPFTLTTSNKRLLPEGAGCANAVPTGGRRRKLQADLLPSARPPFLLPLAAQEQLWISQGGTNQGSFPVTVAGSWLGFPPSRENEHLVSQGGVPTKAPEATVTRRTAAEKDLPTPSRAARVPQHRPNEQTQKAAPAPSHLGGCLSQVSRSFMATTKSFSSLLTFGLISC